MSSNTDLPKHSSGLRKFGSIVFLLLLLVLVAGTLATFFAKQYWLAEIFCHVRVQLTFALMICVFISILRRKTMHIVVSLAFFVVNAVWIVPYFVPHFVKPSVEPATATLKIMSANVLTSNQQYKTFFQTVHQHDPDILIVIEVDSQWQQEIAVALLEDYPHQRIIPRGHAFGIGILSKRPMNSIEQITAADTELISLDARFDGPSGRPMRLIATHPFPPLSQYCFTTRSQQLINLANRIDPSEDTVIAGDFNLTPWSPVFSEVLDSGNLKDASLGFGIAATWHAFPTFIGGIQIDHVLISQSLTSISHTVSRNYGSDHRAVIVEIQQSSSPMKTPDPKSTAVSGNETPQVSLVYSPEYLINLGGMERMHPFDIRKYEKIHAALIKDDPITAAAVHKPLQLSNVHPIESSLRNFIRFCYVA